MILHKQLTINAPAIEVFEHWADFRHFQSYIPIIESIEIVDDRRSRWCIRAPLSHRVIFDSLITAFEPGKNLVWESHHRDGFARGDVRLSQQSNQTQVELEFEYRLHPRWMQHIARLVSHFGFPSLAFDHGLLSIKHKIENGY